MKGTFKLFTLVLMAMSVFSCSKESVKEFEDEINRGAVTITAGINNDAKTKTTLGDTSGESTKVYWEEEDSFILTIGGEDYTFEIDPAYSNENPSTYATFTCADAPETIAAGDYVAKYSNATTPTQQAGTKEGLSDYQYMEAAIDIDAESYLEDVSLKFYTKVSVVELTLTHNDFKDAAVSSIALRNGGAVVAEIDGSASFTGDSNGKIVVYFAVPAGKEFTAATITATCGENAYVATINSALTTVEGKLYQVKKSMTRRTVVSSGTCGANLKWELTYTNDENSLTLSITGTGDMADYSISIIPWIEYVDRITSIELPNGLTYIGGYAFYGCSALTSIIIPDGVTNIGNDAFSGCKALLSIELPSGLTSIGNSVFYGCESLSSISIPATVTSIENAAFYNCKALSSINIPAGVTEIGSYAFYGCEVLSSIEIPAGVAVIGSRTFSGCESLSSISIPAGVTDIGSYAFNACSQLSTVTFGSGSQLKTIRFNAFDGTAISSIEIPATVTSIGVKSFYNCNSLKTVNCKPTTPPTLGKSAFNTSVAGFKIYVPAASVEDYKTAENWSTYASNIIGE